MKQLIIGKRNIEDLNDLPDYLEYLSCHNIKLTELPVLPKSLKYLHCNDNILIELPELPDTLKIIECSNNFLKELPELPKTLTIFICSNNPFECPIDKDIIEKHKISIKDLYTDKKIEEYETLEYQDFLLENYFYKFTDILYNFNVLEIKFHDEIKTKYEHLFAGLKYNLI